MVNDRYMNNMAILQRLEKLAKAHPDLRFHQLLWAAGLVEGSENKIVDKFYEESRETWQKMCKNEFCFPPKENS